MCYGIETLEGYELYVRSEESKPRDKVLFHRNVVLNVSQNFETMIREVSFFKELNDLVEYEEMIKYMLHVVETEPMILEG